MKQVPALKVVNTPEDDKTGIAFMSSSYRSRYHYDYDDDDSVPKKIRREEWETGTILKLARTKAVVTPENGFASMEDHDISNMSGVKLEWSRSVEKGEIGLHADTRRSLDVNVGDYICVSRMRRVEAKQIKIAPMSKISPACLEDYMSKNYADHVFTDGDIFPVMTWPEGKVPFLITGTMPAGPVCHTESTEIVLESEIKTQFSTESVCETEYDCLGGIDDQIRKIREMVELSIWHPEIFDELGLDAPKGVLLYGPPGTGKTLLARTIAKASNIHFKLVSGPDILRRYVGESEEELRELFEAAKKVKPCIIFIDEVDAIAPKRGDSMSRHFDRQLVSQLLVLMDGLERYEKVVVIAATNMLDSIDPALRRPGRFDREVEIGIPDRDGRLAILRIHTKKIPLHHRVNLTLISKITNGYTGADLHNLCREATLRAIERIPPVAKADQDNPPVKEYLRGASVTWDDFKHALKRTSPSALREVVVQTPNVKWEDIGGLERTVSVLRESIEWPLKYALDVNNYGVSVPHGILMHGPPGTGKTTIAKAIASAGGYNFVSIKGPELLSMWVGESEKGVREIFNRAKQSSPCVIFFDEMDALVPRRGESRARVSDSVTSQILTEMDGIEELQNVVVIGATNRMDMIDPAMLRPGRFDRIIKIPMPDELGREQILKIHTGKKPVDPKVDLKKIADAASGFSGADLWNVVEQAAIAALRRHIGDKRRQDPRNSKRVRLPITQKDLEDAVVQVRQERQIE